MIQLWLLLGISIIQVFCYRYDHAKLLQSTGQQDVVNLKIDISQMHSGSNDVICEWNSQIKDYECYVTDQNRGELSECSRFVSNYVPNLTEDGACEAGVTYSKGCLLCTCSNSKACDKPQENFLKEIQPDKVVAGINEWRCRDFLGERICKKTELVARTDYSCEKYESGFPDIPAKCIPGRIYLHPSCKLCVCRDINLSRICVMISSDSSSERVYAATKPEKLSKMSNGEESTGIKCQAIMGPGTCRVSQSDRTKLSSWNPCYEFENQFPMYEEDQKCVLGDYYRVSDCRLCQCVATAETVQGKTECIPHEHEIKEILLVKANSKAGLIEKCELFTVHGQEFCFVEDCQGDKCSCFKKIFAPYDPNFGCQPGATYVTQSCHLCICDYDVEHKTICQVDSAIGNLNYYKGEMMAELNPSLPDKRWLPILIIGALITKVGTYVARGALFVVGGKGAEYVIDKATGNR